MLGLTETLVKELKVAFPHSIAKKSEMSDASKVFWENVKKEPPHKFRLRERASFLRVVIGVIFVGKCNSCVVVFFDSLV